MATITSAAGAAGSWTVGATWIGGVAPTAADDAVIPLATTSITINSGAVCRSADFNGCTGTVTHTAGVTLTIGDGTTGAGNRALRLASGMTYTLGSTTTSAINFVGSSATIQTVDVAGRVVGNITFTTGLYAFTTAFSNPNSGTITFTGGTLHIDGTTDNAGLTHQFNIFASTGSTTRTLLLGAATMSFGGGGSWNLQGATNITLTCGTSVMNFPGAGTTFSAGSGSLVYATVNFTGSSQVSLNNGGVFGTLTRTGTATKTDAFYISTAGYTVTGTFTVAGNSITNRMLLTSNTLGSATPLNLTGATVTISNTDYRDQGSWAASAGNKNRSADSGGSGDCGGNTGLTFTTAATQTYTGGTDNWSTAARWTSRVPLPQDNVVINSGSGTGTITGDMPRLGDDIDFSGYTGTFTLGTASSVHGSWTQGSGMTSTTGNNLTFEGRSTHTITSNGKTFGQRLLFSGPGSTYSLADALTSTNSTFSVFYGTFNSNDFNITCIQLSFSGTTTRTVNLGSSTITCTGTTVNSVDNSTTTNLTFNAGNSIIAITDTTAVHSFLGGGLTYGNLAITGGSAFAITLTGANTFNRITVIGGTRSIVLPGSTTTTLISGSGLANGTNVITFTASAGSATVSKAAGILSWDYINLTNIPSTGGATFYAGANSTDGGGNTGWIFTVAPNTGTGGSRGGLNRLSLNSLSIL